MENNNPTQNNEQKFEDEFRKMVEEWSVNESIISTSLDSIREYCNSHNSQLQQIKEPLLQLLEHYNNNDKKAEYLRILADCQKQTATFANNEIERHALNPAIETVFALTNLLQELHKQFTDLKNNQTCCHFSNPIFGSISEAAKIANTKCEYLDIEKIQPEEFEDFDSQKHEIKKTVPTNETNEHKKVKETLISGLIYRGKVLRQAKVSVYRHTEN